MRNILVIYGGESYEHDISVLTAIQMMGSIDKNNDRVIPCYITRDGASFIKPFKPYNVSSYLKKPFGMPLRFTYGGIKSGVVKRSIDCALVCCHGGNGENGALSGMLEMYDIPYSCAGVESCALCMNKTLTHDYAAKIGINTVKYMTIGAGEKYDHNIIINYLGDKIVVKPNSLGSSIGVKIVKSAGELSGAVSDVLALDKFAILESYVENLVEYNIAVYKNRGAVTLSEIERPISKNEILDFADKYISDGKMSGLSREFPAVIADESKKYITESAKSIYESMGLSGIVRIDYLCNMKTGEIFLNEINTVPGSLGYYLFDLSPGKLLDRILDQGIAEYNAGKLYQISYKSGVLENYADKQRAPKLTK